ncbi:uncharacterized protein LOC142592732 isoform X2 [Dermacentor variabilis]|uniref:uncharacterized protein LOC142592732 isoform X2 n=1 Tax=Dermacentor variabilis TaxID=34621 RepID=UPI003F5B2D0D
MRSYTFMARTFVVCEDHRYCILCPTRFCVLDFHCAFRNVLDAQTVLAVQQLLETSQPGTQNERVEVVPAADEESEEEGEEDTFQCGKCKRKFTMLAAYFAHKKEPCAGKLPTSLWHRPPHSTSTTMGTVDRLAAASQTLTALRQSLPRNARVILSEADLLTLSSSLEGASQIALEEQAANSGEDPMGQDVLLSSDLSEDATCSAVVTVSQATMESDQAEANTSPVSSLSVYTQPLSAVTTTGLTQDLVAVEKMTAGESTVIKMLPSGDLMTSELQVQVDEKGVEFIVANTAELKEMPQPTVQTAPTVSRSKRRNQVKTQKCPFCSKAFCKNFDLQQHIRSHTGEKPFQCVICGRGFAQKSNVKKHMQTHKVWPNGLSCTLPAQLVSDGSQSSVDDPNSKDDNAGTKKVITTDDVALANSYSCPFCSFVGKTYFELKSHLTFHKQEKVFKCIVGKCGETFTELDSFLSHAKSHESNMMYRCGHCPRTLASLYELNVHQLTHSLCVTSDSHSISVTIGPSTTTSKANNRPHQCPHCLNRYATPEALARHQATCSHNYPCPICRKVFLCERYLRRHLIVHRASTPHVCSVCHKGFKTDHYLKVHAVVHSTEKPFLCSQCGATFNRQDKLKRHYLVHESVKRFKCPFAAHLGCRKEFNRADKLKSHLLTHSGVRPYECRTCGRGFTQKQRLHEHEKLHSDVRSYQCTSCQQSFLNRKALEDHTCLGVAHHSRQTWSAALRGRRRRLNSSRAVKARARLARGRSTAAEDGVDELAGEPAEFSRGVGTEKQLDSSGPTLEELECAEDIPTAHIEIISATGDLDTAVAAVTQVYQPVEETVVDNGAEGTTVLYEAVEEPYSEVV